MLLLTNFNKIGSTAWAGGNAIRLQGCDHKPEHWTNCNFNLMVVADVE